MSPFSCQPERAIKYFPSRNTLRAGHSLRGAPLAPRELDLQRKPEKLYYFINKFLLIFLFIFRLNKNALSCGLKVLFLLLLN